ncbi:MAG: hypothetical protein ACOCTG_03040, partial [Bacteroidota bacterium]
MKRFVLLLPVVVILVFSGCSSSKSSQTTPEEALSMEANLVMKNLEARGGADRIKTIQSLKQTGEVYVPAFGVTASITTYHLRPNKFRSVGEAMGMEIVSAYDGETPWSLNPMVRTRPYRLSGMEAIALREQACLDGVLSSAADLGYTLEYAGRDSVNGTAAHRVRLQRPDESDLVIYLDAETFLEIKSATRGIDPFS